MTTLGHTQSICPQCLTRLQATLVQEGDQVLLVKHCPDHGQFRVVVWRGQPDFSSWVRPKIPFGGGPREAVGQGCPYDCGLCARHAQRTCTALVEITQRCNLHCPVCFADSGHKDADLDQDTLKRMFAQIMERTKGCNLQLSGGEPTVRQDLPEIVALAQEAGFTFIQLNTNGLRLAQDPQFAHSLAQAGLASVFLQFDGVTDSVYQQLRGRELWAIKKQAVAHAAAAGLGIVLVPTIVRDVNTDQLWEIVRFALEHQPQVRGVHFQPISYFGRYPADFIPDHVTLPELMTGLEIQSKGQIKAQDFLPPGCEHALCSFSGKFMTQADGTLVRLGQSSCDCTPKPAEAGALKSIGVTARQWAGPNLNKNSSEDPPQDDLGRFLARARTHTLTISAMAFQDVWSINLERLQGCCIHVAQPDGRLIPFCAYNLTSTQGQTLYRGQPC